MRLTADAAPQCFHCKYLDRSTNLKLKCKAFPEGIPDELAYETVKHDKPYLGDQGFRFEKFVRATPRKVGEP